MAVGSIVDYLNSKGQDSSYAARKKLAQQYGIQNYSGTAAQNTQLLSSLQKGGSAASSAQTSNPVTDGSNVVITPVSQSSPGHPAGSYLTGYKYNKYTPSQRVDEYYDKLMDLEDDAPGSYNSRYDEQIQEIINTIQNRPDFDPNSVYDSTLYKNYRDQYIQAGNKAMRDTMGNASALTGGYGSTYAQAVGQQAYDSYLSQLGDKTLDIYDRLYNEYLNEGQELYNQLAMYNNQDSIDYGRYRDEVSDYYNALNYYNNRYNQEYSNDFGQYQYDQDAQRWAEQYAYQKAQDALAQQNWQTQFDYQKEQDAKEYALKQQQLALQQQAAARSRSSGGSSKKSKSDKMDTYMAAAKRMFGGTDGLGKFRYSDEKIAENLAAQYGLSSQEAEYITSLAGSEMQEDSLGRIDQYYDYAKDYAKYHDNEETAEYIKRNIKNGNLSEDEGFEILDRMGIDFVEDGMGRYVAK